MPEITSFPQRHLYFVGDDFLYGLEFYLNSLFIRVSLTEPTHVSTIPLSSLSEALVADHASGLVSFILLRNEDLPTLSEIILEIGNQGQVERKNENIETPSSEEGQYQIKKLDDHWVLIIWRE